LSIKLFIKFRREGLIVLYSKIMKTVIPPGEFIAFSIKMLDTDHR
jgi:hypothetical protein